MTTAAIVFLFSNRARTPAASLYWPNGQFGKSRRPHYAGLLGHKTRSCRYNRPSLCMITIRNFTIFLDLSVFANRIALITLRFHCSRVASCLLEPSRRLVLNKTSWVAAPKLRPFRQHSYRIDNTGMGMSHQ